MSRNDLKSKGTHLKKYCRFTSLQIQVWKLSHVATTGQSDYIQVALLAAQAKEGGKLFGRGPATIGKVVVVVWPQPMQIPA